LNGKTAPGEYFDRRNYIAMDNPINAGHTINTSRNLNFSMSNLLPVVLTPPFRTRFSPSLLEGSGLATTVEDAAKLGVGVNSETIVLLGRTSVRSNCVPLILAVEIGLSSKAVALSIIVKRAV